MKSTTLTCMLIALSTISYAQDRKEGSIRAKSMEDFIKQFPMEEIYLMPAFEESLLLYKDGTQTQSVINICSADNSIRFIDKKKDTLKMIRAEEVKRIVAEEKVFTQTDKGFVQELIIFGGKTLGIWRRFDVELATQHEAIPASSTAKVYKPHEIFMYMGFPTEQDVYYTSRIVYVLVEDGKSVPATASNFRKMFPNKKKAIKSYIKENDLDLNTKEGVVALFTFCTEE